MNKQLIGDNALRITRITRIAPKSPRLVFTINLREGFRINNKGKKIHDLILFCKFSI